MQKFLTDNILPLLKSATQDQQITNQKLQVVESDLKIFLNSQLKIETSSINKQMAKKSRQLFILSSDNQSLKQNIQQLQTSKQDLKNQYNMLDQEKTKQKLTYEKQIAQLNKQSENKQKELKKQIAIMKQDKQLQIQQSAQKIRQIKRQHVRILEQTIQKQKAVRQETVMNLTADFDQQKQHIIKDSNDKKKQIIRKYEDKINKSTGDYQDKIYLLQKEIQELKKNTSKVKSSLQDKIMIIQNQLSQLKAQLKKQSNSHHKYEQLYKVANGELQNFQQAASKQKQLVQQDLHEIKKKLYQQERKYVRDVTNLNKQLEQTIEKKDKKFTDTVQMMNTQHRIQVDSLRNQMLEEREIAVNAVEVQREQQNYQNELRFNKLELEYDNLKAKHATVSEDYETKIQQLIQQQQNFVEGLNMRKQYQLNVSGLNLERQIRQISNMHNLQIKSIYQKHAWQLVQLQKKNTQQKLGLTNKLTSQYQSMISDIRNSNQIQIKQKLIQFERKGKGFENKLKDADKKKAQLKSQIQRVKMQMQMRIDSMLQVTETLQQEITSLNEKNQDTQRERQKIINQYELHILMIKNQCKQTVEEYQNREEQMKQVLQSKLKSKNEQVALMTGKLKRETKQLMQRHDQRVRGLQKEYNELKRVLGQKTSLPEDIQALKVFHGAYLEKEEQLKKQKQKVEYLRRELMAKDAIDKVFAQKGERIIFQADPNVSSYSSYKLLNSNKKEKATLFTAFKSSQIL